MDSVVMESMMDGKLIPIPDENSLVSIQIRGLDWVWVVVALFSNKTLLGFALGFYLSLVMLVIVRVSPVSLSLSLFELNRALIYLSDRTAGYAGFPVRNMQPGLHHTKMHTH